MSWIEKDIQYLLDNIGKQSTKEIAKSLGKSERAVNLYIHRYRIPVIKEQGRNLVKEILTIKFVNPDYFQPNKAFYKAVNLTQKRWWDLYHGKSKLTEEEYIRLVDHFNVSFKDAFEARQLNLFGEE